MTPSVRSITCTHTVQSRVYYTLSGDGVSGAAHQHPGGTSAASRPRVERSSADPYLHKFSVEHSFLVLRVLTEHSAHNSRPALCIVRMNSMLSLLVAASAASAVCAQWWGITPASANSVSLVELGDNAVIQQTVGQVALGAGEVTWVDAVRCIYSFCLFSTTTTSGGSTASFVYNVSTSAGARVLSKSSCPATCAHMHVDHSTGNAYTLSVDATKRVFQVVEVTNGAARLVADISSLVKGGSVGPGQTTHCSATKHMYVGVNNGGAGPDVVLAVDLIAGRVDAITKLSVPLFDALWGTCDGSGVIGGISYTPGGGAGQNGTVAFGTVDARGVYTQKASVSAPPSFVPNGLLTATSPATFQDAFIATLYPPSGTPTSGYLWSVDPYGGGSDDFVSPITYFLVGAAWDA